MLELNKIYCGDCLEVMEDIDTRSVDMVLCDMPYGTTQNKWDSVIDFDKLWGQYNRICKKSAAIVLNSAQPFTSKLICSNIKHFKYSWVWEKSQSVGHLNAYKMPMRSHEDICVFCQEQPKYNYQLDSKNPHDVRPETTKRSKNECYGSHYKESKRKIPKGKKLPGSIIKFNNCQDRKHPTQKPVAMLEYLINTYTDKGDLVLDNCIGSGTTAVAAIQTGRNFIGIEKDQKYIDIANQRIKNAHPQLF